jgi:hypothetical protein
VLLAWFAAGWWLGVLALGLAGWDRWRRPDPRTLLWIGLGLWVAVPIAWFAGNSSRWGTVTPDLVTRNLWPHWLAAAGLLSLVIGVVRQECERPSGTLTRDA